MSHLGELFHKSPESYARKVAGWKAARARTHAGEGFIYLAEIIGGDWVKIGFSLDPTKRVRQITCHPFGKKARLLAQIPGTWAQEKALHHALNGHPSKNEYYRRSIFTHPAIPDGLRVSCDLPMWSA